MQKCVTGNVARACMTGIWMVLRRGYLFTCRNTGLPKNLCLKGMKTVDEFGRLAGLALNYQILKRVFCSTYQ